MVRSNLPLQESHQSEDPTETVEEVPPIEIKKETSHKASSGKQSRVKQPVKKLNIKVKPRVVPAPVAVKEEEEKGNPAEETEIPKM